jgi:hypothetical protein
MNQALRQELLALVEQDHAFGSAPDHDPNSDQVQHQRLELLGRLRRRLVEILDTYGWPGKSLVGEDGAEAAWLLALHTMPDPRGCVAACGCSKTRRRPGRPPPGRSPSWWTGCRWWSATSRCTEQRSAGSRMGRSLRPCWRIPTRWMHAAGLLGFLRSNKTSAGSNSSPAATNAVQARLSCSGLLVDTAGTDQRPQIARIHAPWLQTRA